jgi:hypothetical protein
MTPKEALEHDWKIGEKVYVVCHMYDFAMDLGHCDKPIGVVETTVSDIKKRFNELSRYIEIHFNNKDFPKTAIDSDKEMISFLIFGFWKGERTPNTDKYHHKQFCIDKFLTKEEAEKRYKQSVKTWNAAIEREIEKRKQRVRKASKEYNRAKSISKQGIRKSKITEQ